VIERADGPALDVARVRGVCVVTMRFSTRGRLSVVAGSLVNCCVRDALAVLCHRDYKKAQRMTATGPVGCERVARR
jgi:hypothetical protein